MLFHNTKFACFLLEANASLLPYFTFFTLFSFQGAGFQPLLKPDLKTQIPLDFEIQQQIAALVGPSGLEPPTLRLSVVRSSQLSYGPVVDADCVSFAAALAPQLTHSVASPLQIPNAALVCDLSLGTLFGGDSRVRTGDLLLARQALSQLSYIPSSQFPAPLLRRRAPSKLNNVTTHPSPNV